MYHQKAETKYLNIEILCYVFYIIPNCINNHHAKFEINKTFLTCLNYQTKKAKKKHHV